MIHVFPWHPSHVWTKYLLDHILKHLLDGHYFSYEMRMAMLDYFITRLCFLRVVPTHVKHSCVALSDPIVIQAGGYFDYEWEPAAVAYLEMSLACPFPSSVTSFQSVVRSVGCLLWLVRPVAPDAPSAGPTPHRGHPQMTPCCVPVLWGNAHVWLLGLILNLRWTSGGFLLFIKNDFG